MTLQDKLQMYKEIRANMLPPSELTVESILAQQTELYEQGAKLASECGIRVKYPSDAYDETKRNGVFNTDVLATLGDALVREQELDPQESAYKMLQAVKAGEAQGYVTNTIFLEVAEGRDLGDAETFDFMIKYCILVDGKDSLRQVAQLTYEYMTKGRN